MYLLSPVFKDYIWGGTRLKTDFGFESGFRKTAEAWMLSCHKDGQSVIQNGPDKGKLLSEVLGGIGGESFPLLIKLIDAKSDLSVQVHPDDEYARIHENGALGKAECWYILDCDENAKLIYGFKESISSEEFESSIKDGTVLDKVNYVNVHKGDFFFIDSGTLHAIGKGILLAEIQQNSNSTYRVFDYNRLGADGKPRPLHIEKAVAVTKCKKPERSYSPEGEREEISGGFRTLLTKCDLFTVWSYETSGSVSFNADKKSFVSVIVTEGEGEIVSDGETLRIKKGSSVFIPASSGKVTINGNLKFLKTTV